MRILARRIPFEDPDVLLYVRIAYVGVQVFVLGVYYYVSLKIKQKNDLTVLKYVEPANPLSGETSGGLVTSTVRDYDLQQTSQAVRGVYTGVAFMVFLHGYLQYTQPLFIQSVMGLKALYESKEVALHLLGQKAEGDLKRPFKAAPGLFGAMSQPATDQASIKEAEKAAKTAKKDE
ncbi:hypothetical protein FRC02_008172 [Tulasnella sp. 418]|nr:hypothetical protein FRC02_008172 [Tulasnella sp. 418]